MTNNREKIEEAKKDTVADFKVTVTSETPSNVFGEIAGRSCTCGHGWTWPKK